jgi:hypothetical protein
MYMLGLGINIEAGTWMKLLFAIASKQAVSTSW